MFIISVICITGLIQNSFWPDFPLTKNNPIEPVDLAREDPARKTELLSSTWQEGRLRLGRSCAVCCRDMDGPCASGCQGLTLATIPALHLRASSAPANKLVLDLGPFGQWEFLARLLSAPVGNPACRSQLVFEGPWPHPLGCPLGVERFHGRGLEMPPLTEPTGPMVPPHLSTSMASSLEDYSQIQ